MTITVLFPTLLILFQGWPFHIFHFDPWVRISILLTVLSWPLHTDYWNFLTVFPARYACPTNNCVRVPKPCRAAPGPPHLIQAFSCLPLFPGVLELPFAQQRSYIQKQFVIYETLC